MKSRLNAFAFSLFAALPMAGTAAIVQNGSFENPNATWTNTLGNYMGVASGSTAITGWSVVGAQLRGVAWAQNPAETYFASQGAFFVDLSGFGTEAGPAATVQQTLQNLIAGETYAVSIDYWGDRATLSIDGSTIGTSAAASNGWLRLNSSFVASGSQALLSVGYIGTSGVAFVDNVTVTGREAGSSQIPEPATLSLVAAALAGLALRRRAA
jgi:Protein of unknown function (DUF642)/PEP-CTERM motif